VPFDAKFFGGFDFAIPASLGFDELNHANAETTPPGAQQRAKGGGGFAFALAGVDNQ
jgi:hypothetical protein